MVQFILMGMRGRLAVNIAELPAPVPITTEGTRTLEPDYLVECFRRFLHAVDTGQYGRTTLFAAELARAGLEVHYHAARPRRPSSVDQIGASTCP